MLYVPCTLQKASLGPYGPTVRFTPQLDRFARESVVFARHTTEAEQSGTAFASIFSGAHADQHGVYEHPVRLREDLTLVAEAFADAGYETWFWSGQPMASAELGYGQGVLPARVRRPEAAKPGPLTTEDTLALTANDAEFDRLLDRLAGDRDLRAFVQVAFTTTHEPYSNYCTPAMVAEFCAEFPDEAAGLTEQHFARYMPLYEQLRLELQWDGAETMRNIGLSEQDQQDFARVVEVVYETTVHELDRQFGLFLDRIRERGLLDEALIAFTSDHGEVLGRDNALFRWTHGLQLAPESLDVPWILRAPGVAPRVHEAVTRSIDVFPTLAGLCRIDLPDDWAVEGVDLSPALRGESPTPELLAWSHSTTLVGAASERLRRFPTVARLFPSGGADDLWVRVRSGDLAAKLRNLDGSRWGIEVFDLAADPEERRNLHNPTDARHVELEAGLRAYQARLAGAWKPLEPALPEEELLRRLRSLGYVK